MSACTETVLGRKVWLRARSDRRDPGRPSRWCGLLPGCDDPLGTLSCGSLAVCRKVAAGQLQLRLALCWRSRSGGGESARWTRTSPVTFPRVAFRIIVRRTRRRPPRLTLGRSPLWSRRQSVERETPNARIASLIVSRFSANTLSVSQKCHCFICLASA
jgi:hypothetical protein